MSDTEHAFLIAVTAALDANPFASEMLVCGLLLARPAARAIEARLLRERMAERRAQEGA